MSNLKRSRLFTRLVLPFTAAGLVLVTGLMFLLTTSPVERRMKAWLESVASVTTGEILALESLQVRLWPAGVQLDGLTLRHTAESEPFLSLASAQAVLGFGLNGVQLSTLRLREIDAQLHIDEDGNLREFKNRMTSERPLTHLPWRTMEIADGRLSVQSGEHQLSLYELQWATTSNSKSSIDSQLSWQHPGGLERGALQAKDASIGGMLVDLPTLTVSLGESEVNAAGRWFLPEHITFQADTQQSLAQLPWLPDALKSLRGDATLSAQLKGTLSEPKATLGLEISDLRWRQEDGTSTAWGDLDVQTQWTPAGTTIKQATLVHGDNHITLSAFLNKDGKVEHGNLQSPALSLSDFFGTSAAKKDITEAPLGFEVLFSGNLQPLDLNGSVDVHTTGGLRVPALTLKGPMNLTQTELTLSAASLASSTSSGTLDAKLELREELPINASFKLANISTEDIATLTQRDAATLPQTQRLSLNGSLSGPAAKLNISGTVLAEGLSAKGTLWADKLSTTFQGSLTDRLLFDKILIEKKRSRLRGRAVLKLGEKPTLEADFLLPDVFFEDWFESASPPLISGHAEGSLTVSGPLSNLSGEAQVQLIDVSLMGEPFDTGKLKASLSPDGITLEHLSLRHLSQRSEIHIKGTLDRKQQLNVNIEASEFDLSQMKTLRAKMPTLQGTASLYARVVGSSDSPALDGGLTFNDLQLDDQEIGDALLTFTPGPDRIELSVDAMNGNVSGQGFLVASSNGRLSLELKADDFRATPFLPKAQDGSTIHASLSAKGNVSASWNKGQTSVQSRAQFDKTQIRWGRHELQSDGPWSLTCNQTGCSLQDFNLAGGKSTIRIASAEFGKDTSITGQGQIDVDLLRIVVPSLTKAEGSLDVQMEKNKLTSKLQASLLRFDVFPAAIEDLNAQFTASPSAIHIRRANAKIGGGEAKLRGEIESSQWVPTRYDLSAILDDVQIQWMENLPPAVGNGQLFFDGPSDSLLLHGDIEIREMIFSDRIDWEDSVVEWRDGLLVDEAHLDEDSLFSLNLGIHSQDTIVLRNNVAEATAAADLQFIGNTARPGLTGTVRINEGVFFLQDREFVVQRGLVEFQDPWTRDPLLNFELQTQLTHHDRQYVIDYLLRGFLSKWETETRCQPPLSQADINSLLWFGVTSDELEEMGELSTAIVQGVADLILTDLLVGSPAQELASDLLLLDRVDVVTGVNVRGEYSSDPRILIQKRWTELGELEVTGEFNLVNPKDRYLRVDRPLGQGWELSGWYAQQAQEGTGGAAGLDMRAQWEFE